MPPNTPMKGTKIYLQTKNNLPDRTLTLSVRDEGIGISPEGIAKIFNKFYREPEVISKHSGLGMGMYIASKIVHDHGGKIWAESAPGSGSTFHISLPFALKVV